MKLPTAGERFTVHTPPKRDVDITLQRGRKKMKERSMYVCGRKCVFPLVQMKVCMFDTISTCLIKYAIIFVNMGVKQRESRDTQRGI